MEKNLFQNNKGIDVHYLKWEVENPLYSVVISHGMAEHPARYDDLAKYFNESPTSVKWDKNGSEILLQKLKDNK